MITGSALGTDRLPGETEYELEACPGVMGKSRTLFPGSVENCICDCRAGTGDSDFTDSPGTERIHVRIGDVDCGNVDFADISIHGDAIVGQVGVREAAGSFARAS